MLQKTKEGTVTMFEVTFANAKIFNDCVNSLVTLIDEGEFVLNEEGLKLRAMDPSQIAMVDFVFPKTAFDKFSVPSETKLGVNLDDLGGVTSRFRPGETLTLKTDKSGSRLELVFKGKGTRRFTLPLLDVSSVTPKQPKIEFDSKIKINGSVLKDSLRDAALLSAHVTLRTDKDGFIIESRGDKGEVLIETRKDEDTLLDFSVKTDSRAMYTLEYLNDLVTAASSDAVVTLDLKTDAPLRLQYPIGEATVTYYLAPRIENA